MKINTMYSVKIKHYNSIFKQTVQIYRHAVDFFLDVALREWDAISSIKGFVNRKTVMEKLTVRTGRNKTPRYPFEDADKTFYKMPCYMRRAAIAEALGKASSYKSNLKNWESKDPKTRGMEPSMPHAGYIYPALYRGNVYRQTGDYEAQVKIFVRNTWDWITVQLRKSDMDYINKHCSGRKHCVPALQKRGKEWFLDFAFEEETKLPCTSVYEQTIAAVDLGINSAATVSVMKSDGTVLGRHFLQLPKEQDSLTHAVNRIKKAQQHGARKTPRLWAKADGINDAIAVKTAQFIMDTAVLYNADVIVFEHLDLNGKKRGSRKQRLHLWKSRFVQSMVSDKAHRLGMRMSRVNAWGTSRLAYDGSGRVLRGREAGYRTNSICVFTTGKTYNCDLNASYNIGARYFIREILKSLPATVRLAIGAEVPQCAKRSTCTLSALISLNAVLTA